MYPVIPWELTAVFIVYLVLCTPGCVTSRHMGVTYYVNNEYLVLHIRVHVLHYV